MSLMNTSGSFNATNNASDGYGTNCTDRWAHIKCSITRQEVLPKEDINITMSSTMARIQSNIYKAPYTATTRYTKKHIDTLKQYRLPFYCFISFYNILSGSDFGIGGVVAGTTPVTIVTEAVSSNSQASRQGFGSIWAHSI